MSKAFIKLHKDCRQTWVQPEADLTTTVHQRMQFWLTQGERGTSSETIFSVLGGDSGWCRHPNVYCHPLDPDDFRRCYLLLETIPEWKADLHKLKEISLVWSNLVDNWPELTQLLEEQMRTHKANGMYDLMKSCGVEG